MYVESAQPVEITKNISIMFSTKPIDISAGPIIYMELLNKNIPVDAAHSNVIFQFYNNQFLRVNTVVKNSEGYFIFALDTVFTSALISQEIKTISFLDNNEKAYTSDFAVKQMFLCFYEAVKKEIKWNFQILSS